MSTSSRSKEKRRRPSAAGSEVTDGPGDIGRGEALTRLLDAVTAGLGDDVALPPAFGEKLDRLRRAVDERLLAGAAEPVADWNDFVARLAQVNRTYKRGVFNAQLAAACASLYHYIGQRKLREKPEFYKVHTLIYEINDSLHFDESIIEWSYREGERLLANLQKRYGERKPKGGGLTPHERLLLREQSLFITCYGNELKRAGKIDMALEVFEWLYDFASEVVRGDQVKCSSTLANLSYHIGSLRRLREEHPLAESMYLRALDHYYERARSRAGDLDDFFFVTRRIAMCIGPGLGWVNLTRGALRRAEHALATARSLMVHISDPIVRAAIDMLYGSIKRARAGTDPGKLAEAIGILADARDVFFENRNIRYVTRARWELALAYNLAGDFGKAEQHLNLVEDEYRDGPNLKWRANVHTLRSRIRRNQGRHEEARAEAQRGIDIAEEGELLLPALDALIARGEAYFNLAESTSQRECGYADALKDFLEAMARLKSKGEEGETAEQTRNPKISAACSLHASECYIKLGSWKDADEYLKKWEALRPSVEHEWLREQARRVEESFAEMTKDFTVSANNPREWDYHGKLYELRMWFRTQALKQTGNNISQAAALLDINPNALRAIPSSDPAKRGKGGRRKAHE